MSSSSGIPRRGFVAILLGAPSLGACGLRPLHRRSAGSAGDDLVLSEQLASVEVRTPRSRLGQQVRIELENELNPAGLTVPSAYVLDMRLERLTEALAIQLDDTITRFNLTLFVRYQLRRSVDDRVLNRSALRRVASYNVVRAPYATLVAEEDAERRAVKDLAKEIRARLSIFFEQATV